MATLTVPGIVKWGAVSPLGSAAAQTGFFLRAGSNNIRLTPFIDDWGERVQMSYVASLAPSLVGVERMTLLASKALYPLAEQLRPRTRIVLSLPERFREGPLSNSLNEQGQVFAERFSREISAGTKDLRFEYFPAGRAGGALALARAIDSLNRGEADFAIAGGVDSFYEWPALQQIQKQDRFLTQDNLDGFIPGEGAAFLGLSTQLRYPRTACVAALGTGIEPNPVLSEQPSAAQGITQAMNTAVQPLRDARRRTEYWIVDLTHETYGIDEFQTVIARFGDVLGVPTRLETPLREIGDIGAATLPLFAVLACEAWTRKYAPDQYCIALAGSDSGLRGALLLEEVAS
jgi:hypothetical protein